MSGSLFSLNMVSSKKLAKSSKIEKRMKKGIKKMDRFKKSCMRLKKNVWMASFLPNVRPNFMSIKLKRRLTYLTILLFNLCTGLGYAIIFPTIWNYIHERLGGNSSMLGIVISAYSFSSLFANPFVGWWSDKSLNTRNILLVTILAEMIGSILYFIGISTWILVIGRLIAGIGAGGGAAVLADVTRTTSEEERTATLSTVIACRQLGIIIGPSFNVFLCQTDFLLFSLPVDKYSSPGLLMAFFWFLLELIVFFGYYNLTSLRNDENVEKLFQNYNSVVTGGIPYDDLDASSSLEVAITSSYPPYLGTTPTNELLTSGMSCHSVSHPNLQIEWLNDNAEQFNTLKKEEIESINCQKIYSNSQLYENQLKLKRPQPRARSTSDRMIESAERLMQSTSGSYGKFYNDHPDSQDQESTNNPTSSSNPSTPFDASRHTSLPDERSSLLGRIRQDYFRDEIVVLLGLSFISSFAQTVLETVVTPLAQKYYNFTETYNSYIYLFGGIEVILVFAALKYISKVVSDRCLLIFGLITLCIATLLPMIFIPCAVPGENKTLHLFILTVVIDLIGIAVIVLCSSSLLSKLISEDSQAIFQGLRRSMSSLGCIMGPLWGGAFLFYSYFLFAVPLAVTCLILVLFLMSYKKLQIERSEL